MGRRSLASDHPAAKVSRGKGKVLNVCLRSTRNRQSGGFGPVVCATGLNHIFPGRQLSEIQTSGIGGYPGAEPGIRKLSHHDASTCERQTVVGVSNLAPKIRRAQGEVPGVGALLLLDSDGV